MDNFGEQRMSNIRKRMALEKEEQAAKMEVRNTRARNDYDEEAAYESYMNPEPGFQSGPGDSVDAD